MPLKDALELVRQKRPIAEPNPGFILQLKLYEKGLFGSNSEVPLNLKNAKNREEA
jgi:hypothetical protein